MAVFASTTSAIIEVRGGCIKKQQRLILWVAVFATFVAVLDGTIVNVALPAIAHELGGGLALQQWVVNAYLITLGALILIAGSLSDLLGRKKILMFGLIGFGVTSLLCALAPNGVTLVIMRALQGISGALLVPSSLALIMSSFSGAEEGKAIGSWTAWTTIAPALGPVIGGIVVDTSSWRWVFAINVLPIAAGLWLLHRVRIVEKQDKNAKIDLIGALLCAIGLGGIVFALVEQAHFGWQNPIIYGSLSAGIVALFAFVWYERKIKYPMLLLDLFKRRNFSVGNIATFAVYGALSTGVFLIPIFIQQVGHYAATWAGLALLPPTIFMFLLSSWFGGLAGKYGPRFFMAAGPFVMAAGFIAIFFTVDGSVNYWTQLFPGILLFGLGLSMTVAPLTAAILGCIDAIHSGIGSAINNAVARVAGLIAVAALGIVMGSALTITSFRQGILFTAILFVAGGLISAFGIVNNVQSTQSSKHPS